MWAKHLYSQLFGEPDVDNDVSPDSEMLLNDDELNGTTGIIDICCFKHLGERMDIEKHIISTRTWVEMNDYNEEKLFNKVRNTIILC